MSGGTFAKCEHCERLNIYGQKCVCDVTAPRNCDCTYSGNEQHVGPKCEQRMRNVWAETFRIGRTLTHQPPSAGHAASARPAEG